LWPSPIQGVWDLVSHDGVIEGDDGGMLFRNAGAGKVPALEQRAEVRMGCVNAGVSAAAAVDIVYNLGGSGSIFERNLLERCFRDIHVATQHVAVAPKTLEVVGRVFLGMEPQGLI